MGNSASSSGKSHHDDSVDFGYLTPCGVYTGPRDWNQAIVSQLICARRLAPFYRPLEDYEESWDDDQILAARKEFPAQEENPLEQTSSRTETTISSGGSIRSSNSRRSGALKEPSKPEAAIYRGAVECPICFLYYPPNINHSRCCHQAICTECFVQIKRAEPTTTHLVSEPAACPYCVQENFGIVYNPPPWRTGIGSDGSYSPWSESSKISPSPISETSSSHPTHKRRQKSFGADSPEVVATDHIRPDWEAKLAAVRAAVARRANRRIIMRQVGDRLIPVGVTSGRVHALTPEEAAAAAAAEGSDGTMRRSRRRHAPENAGFEQYIGLAGPDLEELMVMEAMRLSLIEHEEQRKKEAEEKRKAAATGDTSSTQSPADGAGPSHTPASIASSHTSSTSISSTSSSNPLATLRDQLRIGRSDRSRSPSPGNVSSSSSPPFGRPVNPPAFSTLSAALSTTATASALLAGTSGEVGTTSSSTSNLHSESNGTIPIVTVENEEGVKRNEEQDLVTSSVTSTSEETQPTSSYEQLVSSSESSSIKEPLLGALER